MGNAHYLLDRIDGTECIRDMVNRNHAGVGIEECLVDLQVKNTLVGKRNDAESGTFLFTSQLPRNDIGVVLHARDDNLVVFANELTAESGSNQVDTLGSATGENNLFGAGSMNKLLDLLTHSLVAFGSKCGEMVGATVDVAVEG